MQTMTTEYLFLYLFHIYFLKLRIFIYLYFDFYLQSSLDHSRIQREFRNH